MDEPDERGELRDLVIRRWRVLLRWLALVVVGIAVVVVLVSLGGDDGFGQLEPDNPTRTYFLVFVLVAMDAVIPVFPGETTSTRPCRRARTCRWTTAPRRARTRAGTARTGTCSCPWSR